MPQSCALESHATAVIKVTIENCFLAAAIKISLTTWHPDRQPECHYVDC
jgi:hypothetical protein